MSMWCDGDGEGTIMFRVQDTDLLPLLHTFGITFCDIGIGAIDDLYLHEQR
jgi:hypothetical protein